MKIGIFDSGLGGLIITHSLIKKMPQYDYVYLGDTARVPYGTRSSKTVYRFTLEMVEHLFEQNCKLIIIACNTASADALHSIQRDYLPHHYPDRRILGVLVPTAKAAAYASKNSHVGVLATPGTVNSEAFVEEIHKVDPSVQVTQQAAPLLVPLIENSGQRWASPIIDWYLKSLLEGRIDSLVLGCTHYPAFKDEIRKKVGIGVQVISQDEIIPGDLEKYLLDHPEIEQTLSRKSQRSFGVTDLTDNASELAKTLFGEGVDLKPVLFSKT